MYIYVCIKEQLRESEFILFKLIVFMKVYLTCFCSLQEPIQFFENSYLKQLCECLLRIYEASLVKPRRFIELC